MKKPATLAEAAAIAQFRFTMISPVIHELYPDASRTAYYKRITEKSLTLLDDFTARYSPTPYQLGIYVPAGRHRHTYAHGTLR